MIAKHLPEPRAVMGAVRSLKAVAYGSMGARTTPPTSMSGIGI